MNKKETTETIKNFLDFNSSDISQLYLMYPEVGNVFTTVLNELSKEYGSGESVDQKIIELTVTKLPPKIERPIQDKKNLKIGDKVYIPTTKKGSADDIKNSNVVLKNNKPYLIIGDIRGGTYVVNNKPSYGGDFYTLDDLTPYPGNLLIGDKLILPGTEKKLLFSGYKEKDKQYIFDVLDEFGNKSNEQNIDIMTVMTNLNTGNWKIEGYEETITEPVAEVKKEEVKMIDPNSPYSLIGFTVVLISARRFKKFKIKDLLKINPKTIVYKFEDSEGKLKEMTIGKTIIPDILKGKIRGDVSVEEIYNMKEDERIARIKDYQKK